MTLGFYHMFGKEEWQVDSDADDVAGDYKDQNSSSLCCSFWGRGSCHHSHPGPVCLNCIHAGFQNGK